MLYKRVLSGMRPTGSLHLGHYHGVLKNWVELQNKYETYFFVADWHAFTTNYANYANKANLAKITKEIVIDWLATGIDPNKSTIFVQSQIKEHAELHLLLSMITQLSWLERVPSYKDQQIKLKTKDLTTYGFLGYPLLQSADILMYKANFVPVGADQEAHVELTREIARRFNYIFGQKTDFTKKLNTIVNKMGEKQIKIYNDLCKVYQKTGDNEILAKVDALLASQKNINVDDKKILASNLRGVGKTILVEPQTLLTKTAKMLGLDGQKMSKSYNNTILLRDPDEVIELKIKRMQTDPQRVKLTDKGNPEKCPVWQLHKIYSNKERRDWVVDGCTKAKIGCIDCKMPIIKDIQNELVLIKQRIAEYEANPSFIEQVIFEGNQKASIVAKDTIAKVRVAMGLS